MKRTILVRTLVTMIAAPAFGQTIYQTTFDDDAGWSFGGLWHVDASPGTLGGNPQCPAANALPFVSPPFSLNFNNGVDIQGGEWVKGFAQSPPIDLCGTHAPVLRFQSAWCVEPDCVYDQRYVEVKSGFTTVLRVCLDTLDTTLATWELEEFPLDSTWGVVRVGFWFDSVDETNNKGSGWFVDDLSIVDDTTGLVRYCTGAPNSAHASGAAMGFAGSTSIAENDFTLRATCCPSNQLSLFLASQTPAQFPSGDGFFCLGGPYYRLYPASPTGTFGAPTYAFDLATPPAALPVVAGSTWRFQNWYRDPGVGQFGFNFSDGVEVTFDP